MKSAREIALLILYKVEYEGAYPNLELKNVIPKETEQRDKALITSIVYGVINKKLTIDYIIKKYSKIKIKKISKFIHQILRMGIYQIKFMDKIPDNAVVNECVKLAKRYGHSVSSGFVNGVLRSFAKDNASGIEIAYPTDKIEYLSVKYSYPEWICDDWINQFGYEFTEELMKAYDIEPELNIRPNNLKINIDDLSEKLGDKVISKSDNSIVCKGLNVADDELYKQGYYSVQDKAAMTAVEVLEPLPNEIVIDMCAAPGGKTCYMAEMMQNKGKIYAFDIYEHKIKLINDAAKRLGIDIIDARIKDASTVDISIQADKILCDVPCSGMGILRRKPDIKWNRSNDDDDFATIQFNILENAIKMLKNNGCILYSTCTIEKKENEDITNKFLNKYKNFKKVYEKTFYPHIDGTDGFYICKMQKTE